MNLPPDQPTKSKMTAGSRRTRQADRVATIRLRMAIWRGLDKREITTLAAIRAAGGMPSEAAKLLTGRYGARVTWRGWKPWRHGLGCRCRNQRAATGLHDRS